MSEQKKVYEITVRETGLRFLCPEDEMLFTAMQHARCGPVHYGCYGGGCGACKMKIVSGEYVLAKRMSRAHITQEEEDQGTVLICCVQPRGNMVVTREGI